MPWPGGNPNWKKGVSGNPKGRPLGCGGKHAQMAAQNALEIMAEWMAENYSFSDRAGDERLKESTRILLTFARDSKVPTAVRIAAAAAAAKSEPQFPYSPINIPSFTSIKEAEDFKLSLSQREARRELDSDSVSTAISRVNEWIKDQRDDNYEFRADEELRIKLEAQGAAREIAIRIEGGLPALPGTQVIMPGDAPPKLNGANGHAPVIDHQPTNESIQQEPPAGET